MDRKSLLILVISIGILMLWFPTVNKWYPPVPVETPPPGEAGPTNGPAAPETPTVREAPPEWTAAPAAPAIVPSAVPEELLVLETEEARYTITTRGGGLKRIELKDYAAFVGRQARKRPPGLATLNERAPVPVFTFLGSEELQGDGVYEVERSGAGVVARKTLPNGVRITKEFVPDTNHLVSVRVRLENVTDEPVTVPNQEWVIGTATPLDPYDKAMFMGLIWFDGADDTSVNDGYFANRTLGCFPGTPRSEYVAGQSNVVWAALHNRFFSLITIPSAAAPAPRLVSRKIELPGPSAAELARDKRLVAQPFGFQTAFLYPALRLDPGAGAERSYQLFAGPKEYRLLDRLGSGMGNRLDLIMGFGGFFGFFAKGLLLSMNGLHALGFSYGLAIIGITIIIKLLFWPLTQVSTRSMKRMQALQPQMKALQEKYKDDPQKMNRKLMEFMKENKVNPAAGCLPILIQLPIFFGFYRMLQSAIELRGARFLWATDLSQPDTIFDIPGLGFPVNPLPLIMGLTQLWQTRLTPPSPGMDPVQQKMLQYMPLIFLFILYNFSSGLTLYWTIQNLLTIAQMKLTRASEARAAEARGGVTAKPTSADPAALPPHKKKG